MRSQYEAKLACEIPYFMCENDQLEGELQTFGNDRKYGGEKKE